MEALKFDRKILVEEAINGIEVECAVLGNENVISSCVGEIKPADEFYSYDAKYKNTYDKKYIIYHSFHNTFLLFVFSYLLKFLLRNQKKLENWRLRHLKQLMEKVYQG
jgi:hypothetical protein